MLFRSPRFCSPLTFPHLLPFCLQTLSHADLHFSARLFWPSCVNCVVPVTSPVPLKHAINLSDVGGGAFISVAAGHTCAVNKTTPTVIYSILAVIL